MKQQKVSIHTPFIRLQDLLKYAAVVSTGGEAKQLIQSGQVALSDGVCQMRGKKLYPGDRAIVTTPDETWELIVT